MINGFDTRIAIAGIVVSVHSISDFSRRFAAYLDNSSCSTTPGNADITVRISEAELQERHQKLSELDMRSVESFLIYEKICDELPRFYAFMLHAATLLYQGKAYAFCAESGTGKTTHAELWRAMLGNQCRYLNGDKPIIRTDSGTPIACGTPWKGKENFGENTTAPLAGICRIVRGEKPSIRKLEKREMLFSLLPAIHKPDRRMIEDRLLAAVGRVVEQVPMFELHCDISETAAKLSFATMTGEAL